MRLEPVADIPALSMKGHVCWVCVADLHLGIEAQLRRAGFNIPTQAPKMLSSLEQLASHGERLLILGDLKHRIPSVSYREDKEIPPFLGRLLELFKEITVVAGNHDGGISSILPETVKAHSGAGIKVEDVGAFHGHVWPAKGVMAASRLVMGHIHPSVLLTDSLGTRTNEKCWVRAGLDRAKVAERYESCPGELVIVPAFNPLFTGTPVNSSEGGMLGPFLRNHMVDRSTMRAYLLDGTDLGIPPTVAPVKRRRRMY